MSRTDSLTGCYNRGHLNELLPREIKRALRYRHSMALAMCDIDHFKKVNDTYGHQCGDEVLKIFVQSISELIRTDTDWLARYGGGEIFVVVPATKIEKAELPESGMTNFNFLTENGIYSISKSLSELESGKSEFSNLFVELNEVISQIRMKSGE